MNLTISMHQGTSEAIRLFTKCTRGWCRKGKDGKIWWENTEHVAYYCSFLLFNQIMNSEGIFSRCFRTEETKFQTSTNSHHLEGYRYYS
jgi:hypothetical protein